MKLTHTQSVDTPIDGVWERFMDLHTIGRCFPGATITRVEGDTFDGQIAVRVGFFTLSFIGAGEMTVRDHERHHAVIRSHGKERHGLGQADMVIDLVLSEPTNGGTTMTLTSDLDVRGLPTKLGNGLAQAISGPLVRRFLTCIGTV